MTTNGISGSSSVAAANATQSTRPVGKDADGDNDGSKASAASKIGPAVILSLSNTAPDAAQGDPDHDGK